MATSRRVSGITYLPPGGVGVGGRSRTSIVTVHDAFSVVVLSNTANRNLYNPGWKPLSENCPSAPSCATGCTLSLSTGVNALPVLGPLISNLYIAKFAV